MVLRAAAMSLMLALTAATVAFAQHDGGAVPCAGAPVSVQGARGAEAETACEGARAAFAFFAPLGITLPTRVPLQLSDALPEGVRRDAVGCFSIESGRVVVLHFEAFVRRGRWLGLPPDARLYRSAFVHETAHAIAACHAGERRLPSAAQEYVAYVAMLATLPPSMREAVLAQHPDAAFDGVGEINELVYAFDPTRFAVASYRHWIGQSDPPRFLRRVLDGEVVAPLSLR